MRGVQCTDRIPRTPRIIILQRTLEEYTVRFASFVYLCTIYIYYYRLARVCRTACAYNEIRMRSRNDQLLLDTTHKHVYLYTALNACGAADECAKSGRAYKLPSIQTAYGKVPVCMYSIPTVRLRRRRLKHAAFCSTNNNIHASRIRVHDTHYYRIKAPFFPTDR